MGIAFFLYTSGQQELQARMYAELDVHQSNTFGMQNNYAQQPTYNNVGGDKSEPGLIGRWLDKHRKKKAQKLAQQKEAMEQEVNRILDKVSKEGIGSLDNRERDLLNNASQKYRK